MPPPRDGAPTVALTRVTKRSPLHSSISLASRSCFAHTVASASSSHTKARELLMCPSSPMTKARYSAISPPLLRPSQFTRKPSHRAGSKWVGDQQPCLGVVALAALESAVLEAVRYILDAGCQHSCAALGAARALDRQEFWIKLLHRQLGKNQTEARPKNKTASGTCPSGTRQKCPKIFFQTCGTF